MLNKWDIVVLTNIINPFNSNKWQDIFQFNKTYKFKESRYQILEGGYTISQLNNRISIIRKEGNKHPRAIPEIRPMTPLQGKSMMGKVIHLI